MTALRNLVVLIAVVAHLAGVMPAMADASLPQDITPLFDAGYQPQSDDEKGLWYLFDELERELKTSPLLAEDESVNTYVSELVAKLAGPYAGDVRVYILHDASFNASMAPNGMMLVHSGLLLRVRNEAQLVAVLGHELGHYLRLHSLRQWRGTRRKTSVMQTVLAAGGIATGIQMQGLSTAGTNWWLIADTIALGLGLSILSYSRAQEREADAYGIKLMAEAGYTPDAAADLWQQVISEGQASANELNRRYRDRSNSVLSTHPPSARRMAQLRGWAKSLTFYDGSEVSRVDGADRYRQNIAPMQFGMLRAHVHQSNAGAGLYLIKALAESGWTGNLRFFEGEIYARRGQSGDEARAAKAYAAAVALPDAPPEAWRAHGYACQKAGDVSGALEAFDTYLALVPEAPDAAMIRYSVATLTKQMEAPE
ncbi:MAG: M48 family metalloprotease [Pseudomonadota bacterium]